MGGTRCISEGALQPHQPLLKKRFVSSKEQCVSEEKENVLVKLHEGEIVSVSFFLGNAVIRNDLFASAASCVLCHFFQATRSISGPSQTCYLVWQLYSFLERNSHIIF